MRPMLCISCQTVAGAMGGQNRVGGGANGMIGGQRLLREDVNGGAENGPGAGGR